MKKDFDLVVLEFGYHKFAVPRDFALKLFDAAQGENFYQLEDKWEAGVTRLYVKPMEQNTMPKLSILNPVLFYTGIENQKMLEEKERTKNAT
jgi:hypothetical protein